MRVFVLIVFILSALILPPPVSAQTTQVCIDIPTSFVAPIQAKCEQLRVLQRRKTMTNEECAELTMKIGLAWLDQTTERAASQAALEATLTANQQALDNAFPGGAFYVCGDGVEDHDPTIPYDEECDDGNNDDGDGCSASCTIEPAPAPRPPDN